MTDAKCCCARPAGLQQPCWGPGSKRIPHVLFCVFLGRFRNPYVLPVKVFLIFFSPRDLRAPSADPCETLPHDRHLGALYNASPKIRGPSLQRNWGPKVCKIRRDFRQLQTSIANISGTGQDIQNLKTSWSRAIPPAFHEKSPVNFGPLTTENWMWVWTHPNWIFRQTIFRPLEGNGHSNFNTHYRLTKAC